MSTATVPTSQTAWAAELNSQIQRTGWGAFDTVGNSVLEGVQNWSLKGDGQTSIGVWGNVVEGDPYAEAGDPLGEPAVQWCIYVGDCVDPQECGFSSAEDAMAKAERLFPEMF